MSMNEKTKAVYNTLTECADHIEGIKFDLHSKAHLDHEEIDAPLMTSEDEDYIYKVANELLYLADKVNAKMLNTGL